MDPDLWRRLKPLFESAAELPAAERKDFVLRQVGDDPRAVEQLMAMLGADVEESSMDEQPFLTARALLPHHNAFEVGEVVLGRFQILRHLGTGGMGEVYEAMDREMGRIALKTLRADLANEPEVLKHFRREVLLARRISSTHVCRIHEFFMAPTQQGHAPVAFLTMEFLEGVTLAEKIRTDGRMPWETVRMHVAQICEGLHAMHEEGIIHRDLKSQNIMLVQRGGQQVAVLMDFGLAHEVAATKEGNTSQSISGHLLAGTPKFMAPEQFRGARVNAATDIYALGIVLYEMLAGKHPFEANSVLEAAVMSGRPLRLQNIPHLPRRCQLILDRCTAYEPEKRYRSARDLQSSLTSHLRAPTPPRFWPRVGVAAACTVILLVCTLLLPPVQDRLRGMLLTPKDRHIAVLPFAMTGNEPANVAVKDGLRDSLINRISRLQVARGDIWVIPGDDWRFQKTVTPADATKNFGANLVVSGQFERTERLIRLKLSLMNTTTMRLIGSTNIVNENGDLAVVQDEATTWLRRLLHASGTRETTQELHASSQGAAYEDYLAGLGYYQRYDKPGNLNRASKSLQQAIAKDADFTLAFAKLAQVYTMRYRLEANPEWLRQAEVYASRAAAMDNRSPASYIAIALVHEQNGNSELAIEEFQRAADIEPRNSDALAGLARCYRAAGRMKDAEAAYQKAAALRPSDWSGYNSLGLFYKGLGRYGEAITYYQKALSLAPDNFGIYSNLGVAYMDQDEPSASSKAEAALLKAIHLNPNYDGNYANLTFLYMEQHRFEEAMKAALQTVQLNQEDTDGWINLANTYEWMGKKSEAESAREKAVRLLERAVLADPLDGHAHAALTPLLASMGLKERSLDHIRSALAIAPEDQYALDQVGSAYEIMGNRHEAIRHLRLALDKGLARKWLSADPALSNLLPMLLVPDQKDVPKKMTATLNEDRTEKI